MVESLCSATWSEAGMMGESDMGGVEELKGCFSLPVGYYGRHTDA